MSLVAWGWNAFVEAAAAVGAEEGLVPGRVVAQHRGLLRVALAEREVWAIVAGSLRHRSTSRAELPVVGDWVLVGPRIQGERTRISAVLPRRTRFSRKAAGHDVDEQVVAANIDTVWIVTALTGDLNPRRLERYLALAWESGASTAIVLTKADLCDDLDSALSAVAPVASGVAVFPISAKTEFGIETLRASLSAGTTVALLGSSGVGKSTLVNRLAGAELMPTLEVSSHDGRGRHATTHREIIPIPGGALVVDTPGMREIALWDADGGMGGAFPEVESIARGCRFGDCRHEIEPGCAVLEAVADGRLAAERVESYRRLRRELAYLDRKQNARARAEEQRRWKIIQKSLRFHHKSKS